MEVRPLSGRLLSRGQRKGGQGSNGKRDGQGKAKGHRGVAKAEEEEDDKMLCGGERQSNNGSVGDKEDVTTNGSVSIGRKPGL